MKSLLLLVGYTGFCNCRAVDLPTDTHACLISPKQKTNHKISESVEREVMAVLKMFFDVSFCRFISNNYC